MAARKNEDRQDEEERQPRPDENVIGGPESTEPSTASAEDVRNAPDSAEVPHRVASRGVLAAGADRPHQDPPDTGNHEVIIGTDVRVDEPAEGTVSAAREEENANRLPFAREPEPPAPQVDLPAGAYDSQAFRAANAGARDAFAQVVRRPGFVFRDHGGRYVDINDISRVFDVEPGMEVPDGLFLFPINYLVREDERAARLRG